MAQLPRVLRYFMSADQPTKGWPDFRGIGGRFAVEWVAGLAWNRWPVCRGIGGRFRVELVATLPWNTHLLTISGWMLAYAGVFVLGFGGCRWTSDMAIGYFKSVLNVALQLFTMVLLVGLGRTFVSEFYDDMSADIALMELAVMAVVAAVLLFLVSNLPPQIGALAGGTTGSIGSNFGAGTAVAAAAVLAGGVSAAGAALAGSAASAAGGAQALMAAFSKANSSESFGSGTSAHVDSAGGGGTAGSGGSGSGGGSALAEAMGDSGGSSIPSDDSSSASGSSSSSDASDSESSGASTSSAKSNEASGKVRTGGALAATGSLAAKVGKVAVGTAVNLAQGSWDVAKENVMNRTVNTIGAKIASTIKAREKSNEKENGSPKFGDNSLSAGSETADSASEIAAFRDRKSNSG